MFQMSKTTTQTTEEMYFGMARIGQQGFDGGLGVGGHKGTVPVLLHTGGRWFR